MNISDLTVGAFAKYLNEPDDIKSYTCDIVKWLLNEENNNLKKIVIQVKQDNHDIQISRMRLKLSKLSERE
jgi:hypothetical protein